MGDMGEVWEGYKEAQQERREKRLPVRTAQILSLIKLGYKVERKTLYMFRINDHLDVWPIHNRYHDIKLNKRGGYKDVIKFIINFFKNT